MITHRIDNTQFRERLKRLETDVVRRAKNTVELTAREAVNYATSLTSNTVPGIKSGDGERLTHPGGWADRTSNLVNSIQASKPKVSAMSVSAEFGVIENIGGSMEYAEQLDQRDGFSVLGGADENAKKALKRNWEEIRE